MLGLAAGCCFGGGFCWLPAALASAVPVRADFEGTGCRPPELAGPVERSSSVAAEM